MVSETSPRPDILERAKAADIDSLACTDWGALQDKHARVIKKIRAYIIKDAIAVCDAFDWRDEEIRRQREEIDAKDARIKELEEANRNIDKRRDEMAAFIERLEAALLDSLAARLYYEHYPGVSDAYSWHDYPEDACHCMPKEKFREKAREALERIKAETGSGDHVAGANKLILTAEQREEEGKRDA